MTDTFKSLGETARALLDERQIMSLQSERREIMAQIRRNVHRAGSDGCYRRINQIDRQLAQLDDPRWAENKKVKWDGSKWRPVPCPQDEGQFEAAARQRDAREGFGDE